jgi:hypothetical protein
MAEKGRQIALANMTYDALMKKMLCFLSKRGDNKENGIF